jgi:hypothetical protein
MWRRVTIAPAEVPVDLFAALGATLGDAFDAVAFVDLLVAAPAVPAALAGADFDAAALRAGAFLAVVLVADFAMGEILLMRGLSSSHSMKRGNAVGGKTDEQFLWREGQGDWIPAHRELRRNPGLD